MDKEDDYEPHLQKRFSFQQLHKSDDLFSDTNTSKFLFIAISGSCST